MVHQLFAARRAVGGVCSRGEFAFQSIIEKREKNTARLALMMPRYIASAFASHACSCKLLAISCDAFSNVSVFGAEVKLCFLENEIFTALAKPQKPFGQLDEKRNNLAS